MKKNLCKQYIGFCFSGKRDSGQWEMYCFEHRFSVFAEEFDKPMLFSLPGYFSQRIVTMLHFVAFLLAVFTRADEISTLCFENATKFVKELAECISNKKEISISILATELFYLDVKNESTLKIIMKVIQNAGFSFKMKTKRLPTNIAIALLFLLYISKEKNIFHGTLKGFLEKNCITTSFRKVRKSLLQTKRQKKYRNRILIKDCVPRVMISRVSL